MNKDEFTTTYVNYMMEGGHSFDPWDIATAWDHYQVQPEDFSFLQKNETLKTSK